MQLDLLRLARKLLAEDFGIELTYAEIEQAMEERAINLIRIRNSIAVVVLDMNRLKEINGT